MKQDVTFKSGGQTISAHLFIPDDQKADQTSPAIVTVTPAGGIKEQTSGLYAKRMCEKGFVTLAFDHRSYGESDGEPRCNENPFDKSEDIKNAVTFLGTVGQVDRDRIGAIGVCAGGGYVPYTAATERRIKAVATVSAVPSLRPYFMEDMGMGKEGIINMLEMAGDARQATTEGGAPVFIPMLPDEIPDEIPDAGKSFLTEASDYYKTPRAGHPNWQNHLSLSSYEAMVSYSAFELMDMISPHPMLFIAGTKAMTAHYSEEAYEAAEEPKELFHIEGATHFDLYDRDPYVSQAIDKMDGFFKQNL